LPERRGRDDEPARGCLNDALNAVAAFALLDLLDQPVPLEFADMVAEPLPWQTQTAGDVGGGIGSSAARAVTAA
jgi:hypothetical protein